MSALCATPPLTIVYTFVNVIGYCTSTFVPGESLFVHSKIRLLLNATYGYIINCSSVIVREPPLKMIVKKTSCHAMPTQSCPRNSYGKNITKD